MLKKIIKETWMDFLSIFLVVGVGLFIVSVISWNLVMIPIFFGIVLGSKPYVKIMLIMDKKSLGG